MTDPTELTEWYRGAQISGIGTSGLEAARKERDRWWARRLLEAAGPAERAEVLREDFACRAEGSKPRKRVLSQDHRAAIRVGMQRMRAKPAATEDA